MANEYIMYVFEFQNLHPASLEEGSEVLKAPQSFDNIGISQD